MSSFPGFPPETVKFLTDLAKNNKKTWFDANREDFDRYVMEPARGYVMAMGEKLTGIAPRIVAEPRVNGSIFRIYRDTRFAKDKRPYKNHLGIFCWEGEGAKMECPGFYFHLEPPNLMLGGGIHSFSKPLLEEYRKSVVHPVHGPDLDEAIRKVGKKFNIGVPHYKRVPRGFDPDHEFAEYLKFAGLTASVQVPIPDELHSGKIIGYCYKLFKGMEPIHAWLRDMQLRSMG
jgi:uncharacterized protein (TIGR02453 family)